jgi:hypothetical protein
MESNHAVSPPPSPIAVNPIGKLLIREGMYLSGHPNTKRETNAWLIGMNIRYTTEYMVGGATNGNVWIHQL